MTEPTQEIPTTPTSSENDNLLNGISSPQPALPPETEALTPNQTEPQTPILDEFDASKIIIPDGFSISDETKNTLGDMLKDGSRQEKVQRLIDFYVVQQNKTKETQEKIVQEKLTAGFNAIQADQELGGEHFARNVELANTVFAKCLTKEESESLTRELQTCGLASNPALFKIFQAFGKALSDDTFLKGASAADTRPRDSQGKPVLNFKN